MTLNTTPDKSETHPFSLSSSPTERGRLLIAAKLGESDFRKAIAALQPGDTVKLSGPYGTFALHENVSRTAVMLAYDIGIAPFRSMIRYAADNIPSMGITLLYSARTPEDILFKEEFDATQRQNPNFKAVYSITEPVESVLPWSGRTGRITAELLAESIDDTKNTIFYICGIASFITDMTKLLKVLNVPQEHIKTESFSE